VIGILDRENGIEIKQRIFLSELFVYLDVGIDTVAYGICFLAVG
jgi:hypothetical protein